MTVDNLKIGPMTAGDKPAVMEILRHTPEFKPIEVDAAEELIDCYLDKAVDSGYHILVAELEGSIVGYVCYGPTPMTESTWDMYWAAVASPRKGQGIGGALFAEAERKMREAGGKLIVLETSSTAEYEATRRFHTHQGYQSVCLIPDFYAPGDGRILYTKKL